MPLEDKRNISLFDTHVALAEGILSQIDLLSTLNAYHQRAFDACAKAFDWLHVGRQLICDMSRASLRGAQLAALQSA